MPFPDDPDAMIPGRYERNTLTHRQPGSLGGPTFGATGVPIGPSSLSVATVADREMEGGGGVSQRPRRGVKPTRGVRAWFRRW